jgi:hypothetical protein
MDLPVASSEYSSLFHYDAGLKVLTTALLAVRE